jgi:hypothetical protein
MMQGQPPHDPQWSFEQNRAIAEQAHDRVFKSADMLNEASVNGGNLALRMVLLINGGAAVALLSFMNALPKDQKQAIANALAWLAWGVATAALALGLAYFTKRCAAGTHLSMKFHIWLHTSYLDRRRQCGTGSTGRSTSRQSWSA